MILKLLCIIQGAINAVKRAIRDHARTFYSKRLYPGVYFGPRSRADQYCNINGPNRIYDGSILTNVQMGRHSSCSANCIINHCIIGNYCSIGADVIIGAAIHPTNLISTYPGFYSDNIHTANYKVDKRIAEYSTVKIGNDVWIGSRAIVLGGVEIGDGVIVGAGSVVTKNVEPYSIVAGTPAKLIRKRFSDEEITLLLKFSWWLKDDEFIRYHSEFFNDPPRLFKLIRENLK